MCNLQTDIGKNGHRSPLREVRNPCSLRTPNRFRSWWPATWRTSGCRTTAVLRCTPALRPYPSDTTDTSNKRLVSGRSSSARHGSGERSWKHGTPRRTNETRTARLRGRRKKTHRRRLLPQYYSDLRIPINNIII